MRLPTVPGLRTAALLTLLAAVSYLPQPGAALPRSSYYFRDLSVTFYPLRHFAARELSQGRLPVWNPYAFEGTFALPYFHVLDLLHVAFPGPVAFSFLLALQFPLAALFAFALLRDLGAGREGAFLAGAVYALGGLAQSSTNLYVFLQALALAPLIVLTLRRAAASGGRAIVGAAAALALGLTTLAVEFVGQAVLLGALLGLVEYSPFRAAARIACALVLGVGLAGIAVLPLLGLLPETVRGAGLDPSVALGYATPPVAVLQILVPNLFGDSTDPVRAFWGAHFFPRLPYFVSLYLGPLVLALALVGLAGLAPRPRVVVVTLALLGLWFSLGEVGGLAPRVLALFPFVRYPSKAHLLPYLSAAVLAGLGLDRLAGGKSWAGLGRASALVAAVVVLPMSVLVFAPEAVRRFADIKPADFVGVRLAVLNSAAIAVILAALAGGLSAAVQRRLVAPSRAALVLVLAVVADLARAHAGLNPQVPASFFDLVPELQAERLDDLQGGRVFSYPIDTSPAFQRYLRGRPPNLALAAFFVNRQLTAPFLNVVDGISAPDDKDLTSFTPRPPELAPEDYRPQNFVRMLPWMRNSAVNRVLAVDELHHEELRLRARVPAGPPGLFVHVFELENPGPYVYLACAVRPLLPQAEAASAALRPGFDLAREVALEGPASASCTQASVERELFLPAERAYRTRADGPGLLVERENFARGWRAWVDGKATPVLRANGKHRAVPVPAGPHEVRLRYEAPGLRAGIALTLASLSIAMVVVLRARPRRPGNAE
jgi:hypothetical protein